MFPSGRTARMSGVTAATAVFIPPTGNHVNLTSLIFLTVDVFSITSE